MSGVTHNAAEWASISREGSSGDAWTLFALEKLSVEKIAQYNERGLRCRWDNSRCGRLVEFAASSTHRRTRNRPDHHWLSLICVEHAFQFAHVHHLVPPEIEE